MLHNLLEKIKLFFKKLSRRDDLFVVLIIVLVGFGGFGLGRLSIIEEGRGPVIFDHRNDQLSTTNFQSPPKVNQLSAENGQNTNFQTSIVAHSQEKQYVASVKGSKYHFPWCSGAGRINEENKIWFASKEEAEKAGYEPAKNCKGL